MRYHPDCGRLHSYSLRIPRIPNGADRRRYIYKRKKVDKQVHLGFDLSVTQHVAVAAANDGQVVFADDLGIYGLAP